MFNLKKMREKYAAEREAAAAAGIHEGEEQDVTSSKVWIKDTEKVWKVARSIEQKDDMILVQDGATEPFEVPKADTYQFDPSHALDLDDASKMNGMHEAPLLALLARRFKQDKIYTNVADVLVSVNPYKHIPLLYEIPLLQMQDEQDQVTVGCQMDAAANQAAVLLFELLFLLPDSSQLSSDAVDKRPENLKSQLSKPHVHSVADRAFRYMTEPGHEYAHGKDRKTNQSIIITGESGAGKTEASKYVMRFLITASQILGGTNQIDTEGEPVDVMVSRGTNSPQAKRIEAVLLQSNVVCESFGNAKTVRNNNSSRFGKYIKLHYNSAFRLVGARTDHFLLEKSRLVKVEESERSYHIFYQLCKGLSEETAKELKLGDASQFNILSQGECVDIGDEVNDREEFEKTSAAMDTLKFSPDEKAAVYKLLASLMHMGNVKFAELEPENETDNKTAIVCDTLITVTELAAMLCLDESEMTRRIVRRSMVSARQSFHDIALNACQAQDNLHALIKHLYAQLFAWVMHKINSCHMEHIEDDDEAGDQMKSYIGILDIFGFEIMQKNHFEQLCINFANEVLQKQFNHHIFVLEQQEYVEEGIDVAQIPFKDNQPIIDLIQKKPTGLLPILEDQVLTGRKAHTMNKLNDKLVLGLYHQAHHRNTQHPNYQKPRFENDQFILRHFAGSVTYEIEGFLEKNNDSLQDDLKTLLLQSSNAFLKELASGSFLLSNGDASEDLPSPPGHKKAGEVKMANISTVSSTFRKQLDDLIDQLGSTEPHYIKCIKPNSLKAAQGWSDPLVIEQLRYSGVLEVVRIRREAFPTRITFREFYRRFGQLITWRSRGLKSPDDIDEEGAKEVCREICECALEETDYQLGHKKVFLRDDCLEKLRWAMQQQFIDAATAVQKAWRGYACRKLVHKEKRAATIIQKWARGFLARKAFARQLAEIARLLAEERKKKEIESALKIQNAYQEFLKKKAAKEAAAVTIQSGARGFLARKAFAGSLKAVVALQCGIRGHLARKTFCSLKTQDRLRREYEGRKATKLQAWARARLGRKSFSKKTQAVRAIQKAWGKFVDRVAMLVKIQALARMFLALRRFQKMKKAAIRIQLAVRVHQRNEKLRKAVIDLFEKACDGDANAVTRHITRWPALLFVRNKWDADKTFSSLLHAACSSGRMDMVTLLEPFPEDVLAQEKYGNCCTHYAAGAANYDLMKYLAKRANLDVERHLKEEEEAKEQNIRLRLALPSGSFKSPTLQPLPTNPFANEHHHMRLCSELLHLNEGDACNLMAGYLKKRRQTDRWIRRWTVLTESTLSYYHKKSDSKPSKVIKLETTMMKKSDTIDFCFEIHSPELLDKKNKEGRLYFQASGEEALQQWLSPLKLVVGHFQFRNDKRKHPMEFLDLCGRKKLVVKKNFKGETALHMVAQLKQEEDGGMVEHSEKKTLFVMKDTPTPAAVQQVAAWLVENGADVNARDNEEQTPLHRAVDAGHIEVAASLSRNGGDLQAKRKVDGKSVLEMAKESDVEKLMLEQFHMADRHELLGPPDKLFGFTYLSALVEKFTMSSTAELTAPYVAISVYNAKGQRTEAQQDMVLPSITRPNYLWWAKTWHMYTPLSIETLGRGSFVVFQLCDQKERKAETIAWGVYKLDLDDVNTRNEVINMYRAPVDLKMKRTEPAEVIMQAEIFLTVGNIVKQGAGKEE
ncbi:unnamed protein product [Chrysoparadoxa australica]